MAEVVRAGHFINVLFGLRVAAAPWIGGGATTLSTMNGLIVGLLVAVASLPRGPVKERYGTCERFVV